MRAQFTEPFLRNFKTLPLVTKRKFEKRLVYLLQNLRHPSLHAKKYDEARDIWQGRVNGSYRFYFQIQGDVYILLNIIRHPK